MSFKGYSLQSWGEEKPQSPSQTTFKHCGALVLKRAESPGQDRAARQWRRMKDRRDWSSLQQESSNTGLESISNTASQTLPSLLRSSAAPQPCRDSQRPSYPRAGAPGLYPVAAPPLPYPRPPPPQGTGSLLTPTSPTPVCTIFRPSSCSSSPFTCSVDREGMVRACFPCTQETPPETEPRGSSDSCHFSSSGQPKVWQEPPLPGPTAGRGREEQDQGDIAQLTRLAGHICQ